MRFSCLLFTLYGRIEPMRNLYCKLVLFSFTLAITGACASAPAPTPENIKTPALSQSRPALQSTEEMMSPSEIMSSGPTDDREPADRSPTPDDQPGSIEGALGEDHSGPAATPPPASINEEPNTWLEYTDSTFNFSVNYPDTYVLWERPGATSIPELLGRVQFLDRVLAESETAALQIPNFSIEVFPLAPSGSLLEWLEANNVRGTLTSIRINERDGYQASLLTLQAPNQFYYVADDRYVFRLIPLGVYGEQMLESFTVKGESNGQ